MFSKRSVFLILMAAGLGACASDDQPDARVLPPSGGADARTFDAPPAAEPDASMTTPDAAMDMADAAPGAPDASMEMFDAPPGAPDAMAMIDAPPATGGAAKVIINEVQPNIATTEADLIELLVIEGGSLAGIGIYQDITADVEQLAVLPSVEAQTGDLIVVHLKAPAGVENELFAKDECADDACYDSAWDFVGTMGGDRQIGYSHRVLRVLTAPPESYLDAVVFMRRGVSRWPPAFIADLLYITGKGPDENPGFPVWQSLCAEPCDDGDNIEHAYAASVDWTGCGNTPTGDTIQRKTGAPNTRTVEDWNAGPSPQTLGLPN